MTKIMRNIDRIFKGNRLAFAGLCITILIIVLALCAPLFVSFDEAVRPNVLERFQAPSKEHVLGTDNLGRDVWQLLLWGSRTSLLVGLSGALLSAVLGTIVGVVAGYGSRRVDLAISYVIDLLMSFPLLLLALLMVAMLGPSLTNIVIAVGISGVPRYARLVRALVLQLRSTEYVTAARSIGGGTLRIVVRHILPNALGPILVLLTLGLASVIIVEASLSFLGLGPPPPSPSWGRLIAEGQPYLRNAWWISVFPGVAILMTVISLNLFGDGLRDILDPRTKNLTAPEQEGG